MPDSEPRRPILMPSPSSVAFDGSGRMQWSNFSPRSAAHFSSLIVPLIATLSSSPVIRNEIEPFGWPPLRGEMIERGGHRAGDAALHVHGAASEQETVLGLAGERRLRPRRLVARRHHIGVAGEDDMRRAGSDARIEVVDVGGARFAEGDAMGGKARCFQHGIDHPQRAGIGRRHRGATNQVTGQGNGICAHGSLLEHFPEKWDPVFLANFFP